MKKEIVKSIPFTQFSLTKEVEPLPLQDTIELLICAWENIPAKIKNRNKVLVEFNNREAVANIYYLREYLPGEEPVRPAPVADPTISEALTSADDVPLEPLQAKAPRSYRANYNPELKKTFDVG